MHTIIFAKFPVALGICSLRDCLPNLFFIFAGLPLNSNPIFFLLKPKDKTIITMSHQVIFS